MNVPSSRWSVVGRIVAGVLCAGLATLAQEAKPLVVLGLTSGDAAKHNVEFLKYDRMVPVYKENGIQASLVERNALMKTEWTEEQIVACFRAYHVIHLTTTNEGMQRITPEIEVQAQVAGAALARYVREGGGLFLEPLSVRYANDDDERYWNLVLAPLGCKILHEGNFDKTRAFEGKTLHKATFWFTTAVKPHPVTAGVKALYLPLHDYGSFPGQVTMAYAPEAEWQVIVSGENEAKSYKSGKTGDPNEINLETEGTYASAPPVVAVRIFGEGRIVCFPISPLFTGTNYGNPQWTHTVETKGDPGQNRPSDTMRLLMNAVKWLAEPAQQNPQFGTYRPELYKPAQYPKSVEWDSWSFDSTDVLEYPDGQKLEPPPAGAGIRGIVGLHSAYSDGSGSVAEYAAAAKAAGLAVIVFADPLEKLTAETLGKLKADCAAASQADGFYACPGIEFTDVLGNRWAFWGEKIVYPEPSIVTNNRTYTMWDGQRILTYGGYASLCSFPPSALLDYKQLRANGAHPENMWWFYDYLPLVFDRDQLIADNYTDFLAGLRDLRWAALASFTRITTPADVGLAAKTMFTGFRDLATAKTALNTRCGAYGAASSARQYASQGPVIVDWRAINPQMEINWRQTRGAQRIRCRFTVQSDAGVKEVKVQDADRGALRRFLGNGEKSITREFEIVQDRQHYLTLEVSDVNGKRAFSHYILVFCYKQGLFRCGDNLNILGPTSMLWHPDRNEMFPMAKQFHNGEDYTLEGWDRGGALCPMPRVFNEDFVYIKGVGPYPHSATHNAIPGRVLDMGLASYNVQIATMRMSKLSQRFDTPERPAPAMGSIGKDIADNEYYERVHTIYAPEDREDYYTIWNFRRRREGMQKYRGGFIWHEGEIRFRKDVTLTGAVPIALVAMEVPTDLQQSWGHSVITTDTDGVTRVGMLRLGDKKVSGRGQLRPGGYAVMMPSLVGYLGFLTPPGSAFRYSYNLPGRLNIGLGEEGQEIKAGTVIPYRFAIGTFAVPEAGNAELERTLHLLNFTGDNQGWPAKVEVGQVENVPFFFTVQAKDGEAAFTLGPEKLIVDLPIRIKGIADNGCAAVYSQARPWFRFVSVYQDAAWFQEPAEPANRVWAGNLFVCDNPVMKLTVTVDGQAAGKPPLVEVHNPSDAPITTTLRSPAGTPLFGGVTASITVPAGNSLRLEVVDKALKPSP